MRHVMFEALCHNPYGLTAQQLIPVCYPDPNREPEYAEDNVRASTSGSSASTRRSASTASLSAATRYLSGG